MKKMQKMIAVLFSVAMCAAMAVPAFAAETDTARNEEQETVMPRAIVYEEINIPGTVSSIKSQMISRCQRNRG